MSGKLYKIGEAAEQLGVKTSVLRFWESVFPEIQPGRTPAGQRLYSEGHMVLLRRIRQLVHEEKLTINGAKRRLRDESAAPAGVLLREVRRELLAIRALLTRQA